jgi:hypothetical protein
MDGVFARSGSKLEDLKHASAETLERLEPFIARLRTIAALTEKKPGVFYLKSKAFLHFHEDPTGVHADVRLSDDFDRWRVETKAEQAALFKAISAAVG